MELPLRNVLIVEDNDGIREILTDLLIGGGFEVRTAFSVHEALAQLQQEGSSVVLLDPVMPHDGLHVLAWLQDAQRLDHHKIVVMPASVHATDLRPLLEAGTIAAFLPKPFDIDAVVALVEQLAS